MEKLIIHLGASANHFGAFAENCYGIYGAGNTVQEAKENVLEGLRLFVEQNRDNLPDILKNKYEIEYHFDTPSFLQYYSNIFAKPALERITGINQKQLVHYISGKRNPRKKTMEKMYSSIHRLADELNQVRLAI